MTSGLSNKLNSIDPNIEFEADDYSRYLEITGIAYNRIEYQLQVGAITKTQGWILHISAVLSQINSLVELVVPFLISRGIPFKFVANFSAGEDVLSGNLGLSQIGKLISIYPENDESARSLAKELLNITNQFKGPTVLTDLHLGGVVYTRYGSFNPIIKLNENGIEEKYILHKSNSLVRDQYNIPFLMPDGLAWPFAEIKAPVLNNETEFENRIYKVTDILKLDPRGNVYKGLYIRNILTIKRCVFKQGFTNAASDKSGRDVRDRLLWQLELYNQLSDDIPLPKVYDLLSEKQFSLLAMQYINGPSIYDKRMAAGTGTSSWSVLPTKEKLFFTQIGIDITNILCRLHKLGFVHRDIVPVNFLINRHNKIYLIDIELAYSIKEKKPNPPFTLGTSGFMSPEQENGEEPTIHQDIYSLAATLVYIFTGLTPIKFDTKDPAALFTALHFFIENSNVANILVKAMDPEPTNRPSLLEILSALTQYRQYLNTQLPVQPKRKTAPLNPAEIKHLILKSVEGLTQSPIVSNGNFWYSKKVAPDNLGARKVKQYLKSPGLGEGMTGVLYTLARINKAQISIEPCKSRFYKTWEFINREYDPKSNTLPRGLLIGASGIALALSECISSNLVSAAETSNKIECYLSLPNDNFDLSSGIAGDGIALLSCQNNLPPKFVTSNLHNIVDKILRKQAIDKYWLTHNYINSPGKPIFLDFHKDNIGVLWFLLRYVSEVPDDIVATQVFADLDHLLNNNQFMRAFGQLISSKDGHEIGDGGKGLILVLILAFKISKNPLYKKLAEAALSKYPSQPAITNFTQYNGMSCLGELYLEAWKAFENEQWKSRSDWIVNFFMHTKMTNKHESHYWIMEENNLPRADLLTGISGIIHFLLHAFDPENIGYPILN